MLRSISAKIIEHIYHYIFKVRALNFYDQLRLMTTLLNFVKHLGRRGDRLGFYIPGENVLLIKTWDSYLCFIRPKSSDFSYVNLLGERYQLINWFLLNIKGGIIIDVGANVGGYTIRACKKARLVIAIEPLPHVFKLLEYNVRLNCDRENVILINKAISNTKGFVWLKVPRVSNYYDDSRASIFRHGDLVYRIKSDTLDNIIASLNIEGAEGIAFKGMERTLEITKKLIIEIQPANRWLIVELQRRGFKLVDKKGMNYFFHKRDWQIK